MIETFRHYLRSRRLISPSDLILVGVSGGIDSMSLLDLLRQTCEGRIGVAHCNFSLRGAESDGDQSLVESYCRQHQIPLYVARFDTEREAREQGESIQMAARRLRYAWFDALCREHGYSRIAIAHHADDSVETFFINLMRGTGLRGLTGISSENGRIIRPLLFARRDDLTAYAAQSGVPYREDSSNSSLKYLRNRLRHDIIPRLDSSSGNRFAQTMEENLLRFQETQRFVDHQIEQLRARAVRDDVIELSELDAPCLRFELYELLRPYGFAAETTEELARVLEDHAADPLGTTASGKRFESEQWSAVLDRARVLLSPRSSEPFREEYIAEDDPQIEWLSVDELPANLSGPAGSAYLGADALKFPLHLRRWQEGDWFIPLGMHGQKKVSDYLIDAKIPVTAKNRQGVLVSGQTIVWLVGQRIDDRYKVTQSSHRVVRITLG